MKKYTECVCGERVEVIEWELRFKSLYVTTCSNPLCPTQGSTITIGRKYWIDKPLRFSHRANHKRLVAKSRKADV